MFARIGFGILPTPVCRLVFVSIAAAHRTDHRAAGETRKRS